MAIDTSREVEAGFFTRWMTVDKLRKALEQLQDTDEILPDKVGNLSVPRDGEVIGYIDFQEEEFVDLRPVAK
jgi:hypothetical protein